MGKVLIPQDIVEAGKALLREHGHEVIVGSAFDVETMKREVADCDAILARTASFTAEVFEAGKKLKVIGRHGVGYDNIDVKKATELGIRVVYTPEANANTVAELALGFIIALARNVLINDKATRANDFEIRNRLKGSDLASKFGVLGLVQSMSKELAQYNITVNAVCPGMVKTAMQDREVKWEAELRGIENPEEVREEYIKATPLGRLCMPEDVAICTFIKFHFSKQLNFFFLKPIV
jgi:phosphoglycerate dehydrogenase-like enzyme